MAGSAAHTHRYIPGAHTLDTYGALCKQTIYEHATKCSEMHFTET